MRSSGGMLLPTRISPPVPHSPALCTSAGRSTLGTPAPCLAPCFSPAHVREQHTPLFKLPWLALWPCACSPRELLNVRGGLCHSLPRPSKKADAPGVRTCKNAFKRTCSVCRFLCLLVRWLRAQRVAKSGVRTPALERGATASRQPLAHALTIQLFPVVCCAGLTLRLH